MLGLLLACSSASQDTGYSYSNKRPKQSDSHTESERPTENESATVVGMADLGNGEQIYFNSCTACHPQYAAPFEYIIPNVTDLEIELAIRDGKKGVPMALGERSPPDGALRLNLNDQDIIDVIAYVRREFGSYVP